MAKAEIGTAKYQSKKLKASGLQKLKFYCQLCEKQCRDANGFKNHLSSPSHQRKIKEISENGKGKSVIETYSDDFTKDFLRLLKINHGTKRINANKFYQEYILNDTDHIHMNSTKWTSLTSFIKHIGNRGLVRVFQDEEKADSEFNLEISFVDTEEYHRQQELQKKQKSLKSEEEIAMKRLHNQIEKGKQKLNEFEKNKPIQSQPSQIANGPIKMTLKGRAKKITINNAFNNESSSESESESNKNEVKSQKVKKINAITKRILR